MLNTVAYRVNSSQTGDVSPWSETLRIQSETLNWNGLGHLWMPRVNGVVSLTYMQGLNSMEPQRGCSSADQKQCPGLPHPPDYV